MPRNIVSLFKRFGRRVFQNRTSSSCKPLGVMLTTMRLLISTLIIINFFSCKHTVGKKDNLSADFKTIDSLSAISRLFDNAVIKNNQILWVPGYQDLGIFSDLISRDSLCHTTIDTTIIEGNCYYVFFRTDQYEKNIKADCHVCSPIMGIASFDKNGDHFTLRNFQKNVFRTGGFGEYGQVEIDNLCQSAFKVTSGWTGTGSEIDYEIYYNINDFSKLFYLTTFSSNGGMFEKGQPNYHETVKSITNKTDTSFVIETTKLSFDSLGKKTEVKYKDQVKMFNHVGGQDIEMIRP